MKTEKEIFDKIETLKMLIINYGEYSAITRGATAKIELLEWVLNKKEF